MSFSSNVKQELCETMSTSACCRLAETYGMLELAHAFTAEAVSIQTEHRAVAARYAALTAETVGMPAFPVLETGGLYAVSVEPEELRQKLLVRFGHAGGELSLRINRANFECDDCLSAYVRGAFLSCGAIVNPEVGYHLEFSVPYYNLARDLLALLRELGLRAKYICRKGNHIVYLKESEQIEDCLTLMGAVGASLELMNVKLVKNIRNNANRVANCESANIDKTVAASAVQVEAVQKILDAGGVELLPEELRELALLRLENPELSLRELGEELSEPLSRSGVNHRLRRILAFAEEL